MTDHQIDNISSLTLGMIGERFEPGKVDVLIRALRVGSAALDRMREKIQAEAWPKETPVSALPCPKEGAVLETDAISAT